ncbi:MAG TPA: Uma2 family endonuclease [Polyangiaceae bacterium]|nr:Uma2 family endonuclease [Polyangiaceae bacterium]
MSEIRSDSFEYVRPLRPRHFPVEAKVPESQRHLELRTALYQLLSFHLEGRATVGSDQFLYFDASDPKACLAPDVFLRLGSDGPEIESWKTWERGTPDLAIEIASRSDAPDPPWQLKLERYHRLGVRELVLFNHRAEQKVRIWDYVEGDLAERKLAADRPAPCVVLGLWWVTVADERWGPMLRLAHDADGQNLVLTRLEREIAARQAEAAARQAEAAARQAAEARVHELEQTLAALRKREH